MNGTEISLNTSVLQTIFHLCISQKDLAKPHVRREEERKTGGQV
jgi:hypothetical protein